MLIKNHVLALFVISFGASSACNRAEPSLASSSEQVSMPVKQLEIEAIVAPERLNEAETVHVASLAPPPGTWRLSDVPLRDVVLSASHIFISHRDGTGARPWPLFLVRQSERSAEEAAALALSLTRQLFEAPEAFDELAREWSDDATTASLGGRLGVFRADQIPEEVLDALAGMPRGQIAQRVVRSELGFHILRRDALPPRGESAFTRIVIGYAAADDQSSYRRSVSRDENAARALALELAERIATGAAIGTLVEQYSDTTDAVRGGDLGLVDAYARTLHPARFAAAAAAERPLVVQTHVGFEIVQRAPERARSILAASRMLFPHDEQLSPDRCGEPSRTKAEAWRAANALKAQAKASPSAYASLQRDACGSCSCGTAFWTEGAFDPVIEAAVLRAEPGELIGPFETPEGLVVARREHAPAAISRPSDALSLEIPSPPIVSIDDYLRVYDGVVAARVARKAGEQIAQQLPIEPARRNKVVAAFAALAAAVEAEPVRRSEPEKLSALAAFRTELTAALGREGVESLEQQVLAWLKRR